MKHMKLKAFEFFSIRILLRLLTLISISHEHMESIWIKYTNNIFIHHHIQFEKHCAVF